MKISMPMSKPRFVILIALAFVLCASATTVVPMSVERLTHASTHIMLGQAEESQTQWNADHTLIFTLTKFRVLRALKGQPGNEVVVKQMGGRSGAYQQKVAGVRHWQNGDQAMLFLHPSQAGDGTLVVTGLMQGNFRVLSGTGGEPMVTNGVMGVEELNTGNQTVQHFAGSKMPLSSLEAIVRDATAHEVAK
ncbi:MAG: hypothetical protein JWO20_506 [Candidatus Angelobacter sp.]|jgi:hypothetical protein|nr:hypothetical protein [Candidatus Angelobacter sp.]